MRVWSWVLLLITVAALGVVVLSESFYEVADDQAVVITEFGKPIGDPVTTPGRHAKKPFIDKATYFDTSIQELEVERTLVTRDGVSIRVTSVTRWRITEATRFFERLFDSGRAESRLTEIVAGETRNEVALRDHDQLARDDEEIAAEILGKARARVSDLGLEVVDVELRWDSEQSEGSDHALSQ